MFCVPILSLRSTWISIIIYSWHVSAFACRLELRSRQRNPDEGCAPIFLGQSTRGLPPFFCWQDPASVRRVVGHCAAQGGPQVQGLNNNPFVAMATHVTIFLLITIVMIICNGQNVQVYPIRVKSGSTKGTRALAYIATRCSLSEFFST